MSFIDLIDEPTGMVTIIIEDAIASKNTAIRAVCMYIYCILAVWIDVLYFISTNNYLDLSKSASRKHSLHQLDRSGVKTIKECSQRAALDYYRVRGPQ